MRILDGFSSFNSILFLFFCSLFFSLFSKCGIKKSKEKTTENNNSKVPKKKKYEYQIEKKLVVVVMNNKRNKLEKTELNSKKNRKIGGNGKLYPQTACKG